MSSKEVRDAVHGLIELRPKEWQIVDSPAFQRLRGVQQLAATHLVYPGARHSRFEHCMGACHLAGRLADQLALSAEMKARVRLAGLLHDIGHGPFSHVSEFVFEELAGGEHIHEKISAAIVLHHEPITSVLGADDAQWIADLLSGQGHAKNRTAARDIIAGPADIDKLDYLLRDSHQCGVEYGRYDIDKVIESARLVKKPDGDYLAYHRDGVFALEGMLLARYHMHRQVYGHKTRVATDKMLVRAMLLGVEEKLLPEQVFNPASGSLDADFVDEYLRWDDQRTLNTLTSAPETKAGQMAQSLVDRHLMKRIAQFRPDDLTAKKFDAMLVGEAISPKPAVLKEQQAQAEEMVAEAAGVDPIWVSMHWEELQNPITSRSEFRVTDKEILLTDDAAKSLEKFTRESEVFSGGDLASRRKVAVYIRPPNFQDFDKSTTKKINDAAVEALRCVGNAGQEV